MKASFILLVLFCCHTIQASVDISTFISPDKYKAVKISPTGKYLAVSRFDKDETKLLIINTNTMKAINELFFSKNDRVGDFHWVNNERLVIRLMSKKYGFAAPVFYGELYSVNVDKTKGKMIFGARTQWGKAKDIKARKIQLEQSAVAKSWASIVDLLPNDDSHILISAEPYSKNKNKLARLYKLNVYSGKLNFVTEAPSIDSKVFTDDQGDIIMAVGLSADYEQVVYSYNKSDNSWQINKLLASGDSLIPLAFQSKSQSLIYLDDSEYHTKSLYRLNLSTGEKQELFSDPKLDIKWVDISDDAQHIYGIRTEPDYPKYHFYDSSDPDQMFYKQLTDGFKSYRVKIVNETKNNDKIVFYIESDIEKGRWFLFDKEKNNVSLIISKNNKIDNKLMKKSYPFNFVARDGLAINGFITFPDKLEDRNLPGIVLVHGGPQTRDFWEYNGRVQLLASLGYAVLQVNYRGSSGYGKDFLESGLRHWGDNIQYDILDGVDHLIKQNIFDKNRICIMGASFGAYSAVQSSLISPEKFRCAIASSGIYDLSLMFDEGNISNTLWGKSYLNEVIGPENELIESFSPVNQIARLKTPLLIMHGDKDKTAPIEHAELLIDKLKKYKKDFVWLELEDEAHGLYDSKNRNEFYQKILTFLRENNPI